MGQSYQQICNGLMADGVKSVKGGETWCSSTVKSILQNEKYIGDAILQKTFSEDLFDRRQVKNEGQLPKYYVHDCHPAIIDRITFQRVQEEMARRSSLRKTSSKTTTEQGKHSGKYVLSGLLVCSECGSPYRRVTYMPNGQKRFVWRCINRIEHGKRICHDSATMEEPELRDAVVSALNEMFRQRTVKELLAQCISAALAGTEDGDLTLPAVEVRLKALQEEQMSLLQLAMEEPDCTEYDEKLTQVSAAMTAMLERKAELARQGCISSAYDSRVLDITDTLEHMDSAITEFDDGMVYQTISSIKVLDAERISVRFKDGTEVEQEVIEITRRVSA